MWEGGRTRKRQTTTEQNKMKISGKQNGRAPASFAKRDTCRIENSQQKTENENAKTEKQTLREQEKEESMICKNDKKLMHCQSSSKHAKRDTSTLYEQEARRSSTPFCNACASASPHWWAAKRTFIVKLLVSSVMVSFLWLDNVLQVPHSNAKSQTHYAIGVALFAKENAPSLRIL